LAKLIWKGVLQSTNYDFRAGNFIWLLPLLIILGAMLVAVEIRGSSPTHEITITYNMGNLIDTGGRYHSVQLVLHHNGLVTWRDLTHHIR
jgi:hypothetical protein